LFGIGIFDGPAILILGALLLTWTFIGWWRDVIKESVVKGDHTPVVKLHLRYGMILFIASEVMFFVAWFWAYFNAALFPNDIDMLANVNERSAWFSATRCSASWPPVPVEGTEATLPSTGAPIGGYFAMLIRGAYRSSIR
jgi:cytochrome c oxidase subunit 3